jgi:hypothetical protein
MKANRTLTLILNTQTSKQSLSSQVENKREKDTDRWRWN